MPQHPITDFTPLASFAGGVLIGCSALLVFFLFGRVAGISGITTSGLLARSGNRTWRLAFLIGLVLAPMLMSLFGFHTIGLGIVESSAVSSNLPLMVVAGLLVGAGTVLGSGCTSGHGVCGLGRLSARSLVAVVTFMATAMITVWVLRHVI